MNFIFFYTACGGKIHLVIPNSQSLSSLICTWTELYKFPFLFFFPPVSFHWERFILKLSSYMRNEAQLLASRPGIWLFSVHPGLEQSLAKTKEIKYNIGAARGHCEDSETCVSVSLSMATYICWVKCKVLFTSDISSYGICHHWEAVRSLEVMFSSL